MKHVKSVLTLILTLLFIISQAAVMAAAAAEIQHPEVWAYGDVQKIVYPGRSIFEYKDDQDLSSTLPFERQDQNISISFANIVFSKNFENKSIASATESGSTTTFTMTRDVLTSNGQEYIYLKMQNKTSISASEYYFQLETLLISDEPSVDNNHYLLTTAKVAKTGANVASWRLIVYYVFKDSGATEREIRIYLFGESGSDTVTSGTSYVEFKKYNVDNQYYTVQLKIQDILDAAGKTWSLVKLTKVKYCLGVSTGETLDSSTVVEGYIRHAVVVPSKVYIDDPQYTNSELVINGTSGNFGYSAGDIINIYGANATKIVGVTIPWQVEVTPEIDKDPDNLRMQYTWEWTMPKSPSEVGDTLTFSNTNMTLKSWKDGSAWDKLYLNGVDKLTSIANLKVDETLGYWTYALASSLSEGNMYQVIGRVQYTAEEYDSLTSVPLFFENPVAWIIYKFWSLVIAVAAFLGLSTTWAVKQRRKAQIPKVK